MLTLAEACWLLPVNKAKSTRKQISFFFQTPVAQCVKASDFRHQGGVTFRGLSDGIYRVEVRTITVASLALASTDEVAIARSLFSVFRQPFFTKGVRFVLRLLWNVYFGFIPIDFFDFFNLSGKIVNFKEIVISFFCSKFMWRFYFLRD